MKKLIVILLTLLFILPAAGIITAGAENGREPLNVYFEVDNPRPLAGESVFVTVYADNAEGLFAFNYLLRFDQDALSYVDHSLQALEKSGSVGVGGMADNSENLLGFGGMWSNKCHEERLILAIIEFKAIRGGSPEFFIEGDHFYTAYDPEPEPPSYPDQKYNYGSDVYGGDGYLGNRNDESHASEYARLYDSPEPGAGDRLFAAAGTDGSLFSAAGPDRIIQFVLSALFVAAVICAAVFAVLRLRRKKET